MACVYIPVQNSEEEVRVALDQLPRDASDILDILKAEQAPLDLWLIIAREYFKQGKIDQFRQILEEGSSPEIDDYYADVRYERIAILNALGAYYSYLGKIESKPREKEEHFILATQYYNKASRIDMHEPSTWVGKGQLLLAKGEVEQAFAAFKIVLDGDRDNVPALLGQACVEFNRGRYSDSLGFYKRALQAHPNCPAVVRLGIGLCHYKLGQFEKARQAFQRVLQLDPENVEALVAMAILDMHTNKAAGIRKGVEKMHRAFEIYPYCAMASNYLANHFFFTGQHFLVEQLTETALAVTNHGPTRSHSFYNLARSYHSKGDYEKAGLYYMASVKEINKPHAFIFPYYGLGQVQMKLGDYRSALSNFEKVLEVYPDNSETLTVVGHIYVQLGQAEKGQDLLRKATKVDSRDAQAYLDLGDLLISTDVNAALDAFKTARTLLKKGGQEVPVELLNNIGVINFEQGELELAEESFKEAVGDGMWSSFIDGKVNYGSVDASAAPRLYKDMQIFTRLEKDGINLELPWNKVSSLFNLARLLEESHKSNIASLFYQFIIFKYPDYIDAYLRLAAMAKARNNIQLSIELVNDALAINEKCPNALSMLGELELKNDDWVKAKETLRAVSEAAQGKDSYSSLSLIITRTIAASFHNYMFARMMVPQGNWNYFAALRNEKRAPKLEATHLEKAKELYTRVLAQNNSNLYAANGAGVVLAEKGQFDVSKDVFTQVQEAAIQMPDVWINLAHVYFAQGNFPLAMKMYENCLRKFYHGTDAYILLYLARNYYEAEQWQECKKTLLRAIHLSPANYILRFDAGVAMQKFSTSTLQKPKKTADEVRSVVEELENAVRVFSQMYGAANLHYHGFDEKKIETHVEYCTHLLGVAKVHCDAATREEEQTRQRQELARQVALAEDARRIAEEQRKKQLEKRKLEDEQKRVQQQEEHFRRVKEQWKSSTSASKRRDRSDIDDEEGGHSERRRRRGGKRRRKDRSSRSRYEMEEEDFGMMDGQEELEDEEPARVSDGEENPQDPLTAAGLEDSDAEDENEPPPSVGQRKRAWSESDDEDALRQHGISPSRERSAELQHSDKDRNNNLKTNGDDTVEDE